MSQDLAARARIYLSDGDPRKKGKHDYMEIRCNHNPVHGNFKDKCKSFARCDGEGRPLWKVKWARCRTEEAMKYMLEAHQYDYARLQRPHKESHDSKGPKHGSQYSRDNGTLTGRGPSQHDQNHNFQPSLDPTRERSPPVASRRPMNCEEEGALRDPPGDPPRAPIRVPASALGQHSHRSGGGTTLPRTRPAQGAPPSVHREPSGGKPLSRAQQALQRDADAYLQRRRLEQQQQQQQNTQGQQQQNLYSSGDSYSYSEGESEAFESEGGYYQYPNEPDLSGYGRAAHAYRAAPYAEMDQKSMTPSRAYGMSVDQGAMPPIESLTMSPTQSRAGGRPPPSSLSCESDGVLVDPAGQWTSAMAMDMYKGGMAQPTPRYAPGFYGAQPALMRPQYGPTPPLSADDDMSFMLPDNPMYPYPMGCGSYPQDYPTYKDNGYH